MKHMKRSVCLLLCLLLSLSLLVACQRVEDAPQPGDTASQAPQTENIQPEPEPEQPKNSCGTLLLVLAVAVIGGGAGWYFKIYRPKKQQAADAAEDYGDDYDDTSPWEDEDETESEDEA